MNEAMKELILRVAAGDIEYPPEPRLFDWREQLGTAKAIIENVKRPVRVLSVNGYRVRDGVDLSNEVESLARMLAEAAEEYHGGLSYYEAMAMPVPRIRPSVRKNPPKKPGKFERLYPQFVYPPEDCAASNEMMRAGLIKRGPGNTSASRDDAGFLLGPLNPVYVLAKAWWEASVGRRLAPTFAGGDDVIVKGEVYDDLDGSDEVDLGSQYNNSDSRFILAIFNLVEPRCKAAHARDLCIRLQKLPKQKLSE